MLCKRFIQLCHNLRKSLFKHIHLADVFEKTKINFCVLIVSDFACNANTQSVLTKFIFYYITIRISDKSESFYSCRIL